MEDEYRKQNVYFIFNYLNVWCSLEGKRQEGGASVATQGPQPQWQLGRPLFWAWQALPQNEPPNHVRWINCLGRSNLMLLVSPHTRVGLSNWSGGQGNDPCNLEMVGGGKRRFGYIFYGKIPNKDYGPRQNGTTRNECIDKVLYILLFWKIII